MAATSPGQALSPHACMFRKKNLPKIFRRRLLGQDWDTGTPLSSRETRNPGASFREEAEKGAE